MTRDQPRPQHGETFAQQPGVVEIALRAIDQVDRIEVHSEHGPVNGLDQAQVACGAVRDDPRHGFQAVARSPGLDGIEDVPDVLHGELESFFR